MERRIADGYAEFHWSHHPRPDWPTNEYIRWLWERGVPYETSPFNGSEYVQIGMPSQHHQTTWCAERAISFIRANADRSIMPRVVSFNGSDKTSTSTWPSISSKQVGRIRSASGARASTFRLGRSGKSSR